MSARASYLLPVAGIGVDGAPPLEFRGVSFRESAARPDRHFDLEVRGGTITGIIGDEHSFALGFDPPPAGEILVFGAAIARLPYAKLLAFRRRLGYLQVGDGLLQNLNLRANIGLPLQYASDHRTKEVAARVEEVIAAFGLQGAADRRPAQATEEERRRAAVARAIALDPELLILESPFDGLTAHAGRQLLELVQMRRDGQPRTIVITAQDLGPAVTPLIPRVVRLLEGAAVEGDE
jgi:ABC-type transporter Mla maintaining outer membrane lipid asymmetry ATPase subunit MlaF